MNLRHRAFATLAATTALCALTVGCNPTPATTPTPTPVTTPTESDREREARLAFEEAEAAYRAAFEEYGRLSLAGGAAKPSARLQEVTAGPTLDEFGTALNEQWKTKGRQTGTTKVVWVKPGRFESDELTIVACIDGSGVRAYSPGGKLLGTGYVAESNATLRKVDQRWKVWSVDETRVKTCDA